MKPRDLLVIIDVGRVSPDTALEGLRVAAGLAAWKQFRVTVCLRSKETDANDCGGLDLNEAPASEYLSGLQTSGGRILAVATPQQFESTGATIESISTKDLAVLTTRSCHTLVF